VNHDHTSNAIDASLAAARVIEKNGYPYLIHPLTDGVPRCPPELLAAWTGWAQAQPEATDATLLLAPEAMALPLAAVLGQALHLPYVVVRKRSYALPGERVAFAETGYGGATLHLNDVDADDRVLLVDDVLSTGGTTGALLHLLRERGVQVTGVVVFLDKGDVAARLAERFEVPVRAMRRIRIEGGKVRVVDSAP
jgi:adenine phosphoribosyltransferase